MATQIKKNNTTKSVDNKTEEKIEKIEKVGKAEKVEENEQAEKRIVKESQHDIEADLEIKKLREENEQKEKALDDLTKQFASMQELINKLMANQISGGNKEDYDNGDVLIGCRFVNGASMATNDGRMACKFECDEEKYVPIEDLKIYLKEANRNLKALFEIDGFYFVNSKDYEKFKIRKRLDLSHEKIKEIVFANSLTDMIDKVNLLTNNKNDFNALHLFQYEICKMLIDPSNPLAGWDYTNRTHLEDYIGIKFDELLARLSARTLAAKNRK